MSWCLGGKDLEVMDNIFLNIADYVISVEADKGINIQPGERFANNLKQNATRDILIRVKRTPFMVPGKAEKVFHAPLFEERDSSLTLKDENFWSVWKSGDDIFVRTILPYSDTMKGAVLRLTADSTAWDLYIDSPVDNIDPLSYPLDSLILYYLTAINGDIFVHASGVTDGHSGYIFSGVSGKGKSTMAKIWNENGWKVIHDDRLIIRKRDDGYYMYNTPVYNNDTPASSLVTAVYLIEHGNDNSSSKLTGAEAVAHFISNCIQHNWNPVFTANLLSSVSGLCSSLPLARLSFVPDKRIIDYILRNDKSHDK